MIGRGGRFPLVAAALAVAITVSTIAHAEEIPLCPAYSGKEWWKRVEEFGKNEAPPLSRLLSEEDRDLYHRLVRKGHCEEALKLVSRPYLRLLPEQGCLFDDSPGIWRLLVARQRYKGLALCFLEADARFALGQIGTADPQPPRYRWILDLGTEPPKDPLVRERDRHLGGIESLCLQSFLPACLAFVQLALESDAVEISRDEAYYHLERMRLLGLDWWQVTDLQARLEKQIGASTAEHLKADAKADIDSIESPIAIIDDE